MSDAKITADRIREEMSRPDKRGRTLNTEGVDFEKLAALVSTRDNDVPGWEAPRVLPSLWVEDFGIARGPDGSTRYQCRVRKLTALLSCTLELDRRPWLHLSVSHRDRIPNWQELAETKLVFLGDREAYQVIPPKERYVNINKRVLHLFALRDEKETALPDFTRGTGSL